MKIETVTLQTAEGPMNAFVASPGDDKRHVGIVVIQEAFGVNHHIKDVCQRFAREGYVALAPELFHRAGAGLEVKYGDMESVMKYLGSLTNDQLLNDLSAAVNGIKARSDVDATKVVPIGYCMGGFCSMLAAEKLDVAGVVSYYGGGMVHARANIGFRPIINDFGLIKSPVLLFFGAEDKGIPKEDVAAIGEKLTALGKDFEVVVYEGAGHAFFCDERPAFDRDAAEKSWKKCLAWLKQKVG